MSHANLTSRLPGAAVLCALGLLSGSAFSASLLEASGIARAGSDLLIVGDGTPGAFFRYRLRETDLPRGSGPLLAAIEIGEAERQAIGGRLAIDLEGIDVLEDGRVFVLSERLRALLDTNGVVAAYPPAMAEIAGRGLEGLAINNNGEVAALWEGGFLSPNLLPTRYRGAGRLANGPVRPLICVHSIPVSPRAVCARGEGVVVLQVPATPDRTQAFRAPDLVWDTDGRSFILLLSSTNVANDVFRYKWLQKFSDSGEPIGNPLNLCDRGYLPEHLRSGAADNYEGLGWFEPGKSLILINDHTQAATAVVISIDPWPVTDPSIACDQALP